MDTSKLHPSISAISILGMAFVAFSSWGTLFPITCGLRLAYVTKVSITNSCLLMQSSPLYPSTRHAMHASSNVKSQDVDNTRGLTKLIGSIEGYPNRSSPLLFSSSSINLSNTLSTPIVIISPYIILSIYSFNTFHHPLSPPSYIYIYYHRSDSSVRYYYIKCFPN